jgi:hypothetical protein
MSYLVCWENEPLMPEAWAILTFFISAERGETKLFLFGKTVLKD